MDIGQTTTKLQTYYESPLAQSNDAARQNTDKSNVDNANQMQKNRDEYEKFKKKFIVKRWIKLLTRTAPDKPSFYGTELHPVKESSLITKSQADLDNTFVLHDFPGTNDSKLDDQTFDKLKIELSKLDIVFYVMDCEKCLREKASEQLFDKFIGISKERLINSHLNLVILLNKFDKILHKDEAKKYVKLRYIYMYLLFIYIYK